jgi:hypothetical protein
MSFFGRHPTEIKLTLPEVRSLPAPHRPKNLIMDLTNFLMGGPGKRNMPQFWDVATKTTVNGSKRSSTSLTFGSLEVKQDTKAAWLAFKASGDDKTTVPATSTYVHPPQFRPIVGGISAEKGAQMVTMFRLAKMICRDGYNVQIRLPAVLGGKMIQIPDMLEGYFITEFLEQGQRTGGRMSTLAPSRVMTGEPREFFSP